MLNKLLVVAAGVAACTGALGAGSLENPQPKSTESGIGVVSGWNCQATAITIQVDNSPPIAAPYGSQRADTATTCGGKSNTGFSYLINYNTLASGTHTIKALADGAVFGTATFDVVNLGAEFLSGKAGDYYLNNFPDYGTRSRVAWQESKQNFVVTGSDKQVAPIDGVYYGAVTTTNSGCTTPSNNGNFYDVDRFTVTYGTQSLLTIEAANSAATCNFTGTAFYTTAGGEIVVPGGAFACTNGLQGTWASDRMVFDAIGMLASLTTKYTVGETCATVSRIGAAR